MIAERNVEITSAIIIFYLGPSDGWPFTVRDPGAFCPAERRKVRESHHGGEHGFHCRKGRLSVRRGPDAILKNVEGQRGVVGEPSRQRQAPEREKEPRGLCQGF